MENGGPRSNNRNHPPQPDIQHRSMEYVYPPLPILSLQQRALPIIHGSVRFKYPPPNTSSNPYPLPATTKANESAGVATALHTVKCKFELDDSERELAERFFQQVAEKGVYDVDIIPPPALNHHLAPLHPLGLDRFRENLSEFWERRVVKPAHFAIEKINAEKEVYLTFMAKDEANADAPVQTFQAHVGTPFGGGSLELLEWRPKPDPAAT